jgi:hypothetical protein
VRRPRAVFVSIPARGSFVRRARRAAALCPPRLRDAGASGAEVARFVSIPAAAIVQPLDIICAATRKANKHGRFRVCTQVLFGSHGAASADSCSSRGEVGAGFQAREKWWVLRRRVRARHAAAVRAVGPHLRQCRDLPRQRGAEERGPMSSLGRRLGPLRPISWTASELLAHRIVTRLCQQSPRGLSWREFAAREIARNLSAFARAHASTPPADPGRLT